jgi:hypothetical protein
MTLHQAIEILNRRNYEGSREWQQVILHGRPVVTDGNRWLTSYEAIAAATAIDPVNTPPQGAAP